MEDSASVASKARNRPRPISLMASMQVPLQKAEEMLFKSPFMLQTLSLDAESTPDVLQDCFHDLKIPDTAKKTILPVSACADNKPTTDQLKQQCRTDLHVQKEEEPMPSETKSAVDWTSLTSTCNETTKKSEENSSESLWIDQVTDRARSVARRRPIKIAERIVSVETEDAQECSKMYTSNALWSSSEKVGGDEEHKRRSILKLSSEVLDSLEEEKINREDLDDRFDTIDESFSGKIVLRSPPIVKTKHINSLKANGRKSMIADDDNHILGGPVEETVEEIPLRPILKVSSESLSHLNSERNHRARLDALAKKSMTQSVGMILIDLSTNVHCDTVQIEAMEDNFVAPGAASRRKPTAPRAKSGAKSVKNLIKKAHGNHPGLFNELDDFDDDGLPAIEDKTSPSNREALNSSARMSPQDCGWPQVQWSMDVKGCKRISAQLTQTGNEQNVDPKSLLGLHRSQSLDVSESDW